jgi:hypothetical protein
MTGCHRSASGRLGRRILDTAPIIRDAALFIATVPLAPVGEVDGELPLSPVTPRPSFYALASLPAASPVDWFAHDFLPSFLAASASPAAM